MTEVLTIREGSHGILAVCKDVPTAIDWLVSHYWLTEDTTVWDGDKGEWSFIKIYLGENWKINLQLMMAHELNDLFDDLFDFQWFPVAGT